jgi:beta-glucosidase
VHQSVATSRLGQGQESYGEDSYHLGEMGAALMRGIQRHVMSCVKHFALNSMENARFKVDVTADERTLPRSTFRTSSAW